MQYSYTREKHRAKIKYKQSWLKNDFMLNNLRTFIEKAFFLRIIRACFK